MGQQYMMVQSNNHAQCVIINRKEPDFLWHLFILVHDLTSSVLGLMEVFVSPVA